MCLLCLRGHRDEVEKCVNSKRSGCRFDLYIRTKSVELIIIISILIKDIEFHQSTCNISSGDGKLSIEFFGDL